jgi:hypothetical protein
MHLQLHPGRIGYELIVQLSSKVKVNSVTNIFAVSKTLPLSDPVL